MDEGRLMPELPLYSPLKLGSLGKKCCGEVLGTRSMTVPRPVRRQFVGLLLAEVLSQVMRFSRDVKNVLGFGALKGGCARRETELNGSKCRTMEIL